MCVYLIIEIDICTVSNLRNQRLRIGKRRRKPEFTFIGNCRNYVHIFRLLKTRYTQTVEAAALSGCEERELQGGVPTHAAMQSVYGANLNFLAQLNPLAPDFLT
jgi:hypothetical protein